MLAWKAWANPSSTWHPLIYLVTGTSDLANRTKNGTRTRGKGRETEAANEERESHSQEWEQLHVGKGIVDKVLDFSSRGPC